MTSREFCYWLQGFFELTDAGPLSASQAEMIRAHLAMVFFHEIDPSYPNSTDLNKIHAKPAKPNGDPVMRC